MFLHIFFTVISKDDSNKVTIIFTMIVKIFPSLIAYFKDHAVTANLGLSTAATYVQNNVDKAMLSQETVRNNKSRIFPEKKVCHSKFMMKFFLNSQIKPKFLYRKILTDRLQLLTNVSVVLLFLPAVLYIFHRLDKYFYGANSGWVWCLKTIHKCL